MKPSSIHLWWQNLNNKWEMSDMLLTTILFIDQEIKFMLRLLIFFLSLLSPFNKKGKKVQGVNSRFSGEFTMKHTKSFFCI